MTQPINYSEPGESEDSPGRVKSAAQTLLFSQCADVAVFACCLYELMHGCAGALRAPRLCGVVILTVGPGQAVYFHLPPCE